MQQGGNSVNKSDLLGAALAAILVLSGCISTTTGPPESDPVPCGGDQRQHACTDDLDQPLTALFAAADQDQVPDEHRASRDGQPQHVAEASQRQTDDVQESRSPAVDVLLLGGRPIREAVAWHGPFVMNTRSELVQAFEDFQAGRLGSIPSERIDRPHPHGF